jgi:arylsulfatase A-like enzyme
MPLLVRYPRMVAPGSVCDEITLNVDFAPTFLELAGVDVPDEIQGTSLSPLLRGEPPADWQQSMYYRYWMHDDGIHRVPAHYGVRTRTHKLIGYYNDPLGQAGARESGDPPEWELFDLVADPHELHNVIDRPDYRDVALELHAELQRLQADVGDLPHPAAEAEFSRLLSVG